METGEGEDQLINLFNKSLNKGFHFGRSWLFHVNPYDQSAYFNNTVYIDVFKVSLLS